MLTDLRNTQPLSHCVARGLQLLGTQVQGDNGKFHSMACDSKFHLVSEGVNSRGHDSDRIRDALPKPGEGIDKISGLTVLAQLFYDFVQIKTTTVLRSKDPKDVASYVEFMKRMIKVFDGSDYTGTVDDLLKMNLSSIKDQASVKACGAMKNTTDFKKGTPVGNTVIKVVRRLFGTQIQHAARCGQLLKQLFLIKKGDQDLTIRIHPNVMLKGFPELDRINRNARRILIDYYSKCEGLYKTGLQILQGPPPGVPGTPGTGTPGTGKPGTGKPGTGKPGTSGIPGIGIPRGLTQKARPQLNGKTRKNRPIV